jgi:hypothetical protein
MGRASQFGVTLLLGRTDLSKRGDLRRFRGERRVFIRPGMVYAYRTGALRRTGKNLPI